VGPRASEDTIKKRKSLCFCWELNHDFLVIHIIAYWLYWLRYSDIYVTVCLCVLMMLCHCATKQN
jgi:hypothetical protein